LLHIFDLDHTLITENSSYRFCQTLFRKKKLPFISYTTVAWYYFSYRYLRISPTELHKKVFDKLLKGIAYDLLEDEAAFFVEDFLLKHLYMPAVQELRAAQHLGHKTALFSNSPDFLVKEIARFFQVDAWRATLYQLDSERRLCGISTILDGELKAKSVHELMHQFGINRKNVIAYSDSFLDLPFLEAAGKSVAVHPDKRLLAVAEARDWAIL
jgi:HAD superfamily hydrolase (TIGR01490 family)